MKDWRTRPGHGDYVEGIGVQDVERGGLAGIKPEPWQTDTSIGDWFYNKNWKAKDTGRMYRSAEWVIRTLVDIVSKNGNLLLNVVQRPDGSLDPEVEQLLADVGAWMKVNGEAIYATRPWGDLRRRRNARRMAGTSRRTSRSPPKTSASRSRKTGGRSMRSRWAGRRMGD